MEEDYQYYADNFSFDEEAEHECEDCGKGGASLYNAFGQSLSIGGFSSDLMLCDACHKERFEGKMKTIKPTSVRLDSDVQKALDEFCKKENRSYSNAINTILRISFKLPAKKI